VFENFTTARTTESLDPEKAGGHKWARENDLTISAWRLIADFRTVVRDQNANPAIKNIRRSWLQCGDSQETQSHFQ